jgi:hypothetical protein
MVWEAESLARIRGSPRTISPDDHTRSRNRDAGYATLLFLGPLRPIGVMRLLEGGPRHDVGRSAQTRIQPLDALPHELGKLGRRDLAVPQGVRRRCEIRNGRSLSTIAPRLVSGATLVQARLQPGMAGWI